MAGHGVILSDAYDELRMLAERTGIPVITTLLGISAFPESHPLHLGMPGMHGEVHVNRAIQQADLIIGVGLRFDDRVTGNLAAFARGAKVIHIELDASEIGKNVPVAVGLVGDARAILRALLEARRAAPLRRRGGPRSKASSGPGSRASRAGSRPRASWPRSRTRARAAARSSPTWASTRCGWPSCSATSGPTPTSPPAGSAPWGSRCPPPWACVLARPDEPVWAISGDGGFQMNMQEIATMVQEGIPVKMAIFNNGYLGMVRQWQQFFHGRRYSATPIWSPDYVRLAEAYGIPGWRVERGRPGGRRRSRGALEHEGPALVEFLIEQEANVFPMIPPGASLSEPIESEAVTGMNDHARRDGAAGGPSDHVQPCRRAAPAAEPARAEHRRRADGDAGRLETHDHDPVRRSDGRSRRPAARRRWSACARRPPFPPVTA